MVPGDGGPPGGEDRKLDLIPRAKFPLLHLKLVDEKLPQAVGVHHFGSALGPYDKAGITHLPPGLAVKRGPAENGLPFLTFLEGFYFFSALHQGQDFGLGLSGFITHEVFAKPLFKEGEEDLRGPGHLSLPGLAAPFPLFGHFFFKTSHIKAKAPLKGHVPHDVVGETVSIVKFEDELSGDDLFSSLGKLSEFFFQEGKAPF